MSVLDSIRAFFAKLRPDELGPLEEARILEVPSGHNFRDLGGYDTPSGPTRFRRFVRSGSCSSLTHTDIQRLKDYGVCRVVDLRSSFEDPRITDRFCREPGVEWLNVPLFDYDLSDPKLTGVAAPDGNYLIDGYVTMLSNRPAMRRIFEFLGETPAGGCALFHCAAGMDRTGMVAMLLLGLAEVPRTQIVADYLYSFASVAEVDRVVFGGRAPELREGSWNPLPSRREAVSFMLDRIEGGYGGTRAYLSACGVDEVCLDRVRGMLMGSD